MVTKLDRITPPRVLAPSRQDSFTARDLRVFRVTYTPAALLIGVWFLLQFLNLGAVAQHPAGGVAYAAHVGGFIFGAVTARLFERR